MSALTLCVQALAYRTQLQLISIILAWDFFFFKSFSCVFYPIPYSTRFNVTLTVILGRGHEGTVPLRGAK